MTIKSLLIVKAIRFAERKHRGQKRKVSGEDYITHPILVSYLVSKFKNSKNLELLICASILHDTLEDTKTTFNELVRIFGIEVASLVNGLTSDKDQIKSVGKAEYLKIHMSGLSNYALFLKLCDRLANLMDSPSEKQLRETREILSYLQSKRRLTQSQLAVIAEIQNILLSQAQENKY
jgi:GTP pyrophosphokinase